MRTVKCIWNLSLFRKLSPICANFYIAAEQKMLEQNLGHDKTESETCGLAVRV